MPARPTLFPDQIEEAIRMVKSGLSFQKVADSFGVNPSSIQYHYHRQEGSATPARTSCTSSRTSPPEARSAGTVNVPPPRKGPPTHQVKGRRRLLEGFIDPVGPSESWRGSTRILVIMDSIDKGMKDEDLAARMGWGNPGIAKKRKAEFLNLGPETFLANFLREEVQTQGMVTESQSTELAISTGVTALAIKEAEETKDLPALVRMALALEPYQLDVAPMKIPTPAPDLTEAELSKPQDLTAAEEAEAAEIFAAAQPDLTPTGPYPDLIQANDWDAVIENVSRLKAANRPHKFADLPQALRPNLGT